MIIFLRRLLLLLSLMFWQGGFTFYGAVVVPIGSSLLGSGTEQGFITRSVTNYLNLAGVVALAIWAWELAAVRGTSSGGRRLRFSIWTGCALCQVALIWMHWKLDQFLVPEDATILDPQRFHSLHETYLTISGVQWGGCLVLTALTLWSWRVEDSAPVSPS
ncbi:hypothetical protein [Paludisphaera rhizosphaerae]|uniref:hypothetical protein n=1 Tax=Paludisphaera rhizosphaerae TaxID=2711216 RepID=UPI0013ECC4D5|nr:hypothetical protein [Paludisphaera rhizosphaerae]